MTGLTLLAGLLSLSTPIQDLQPNYAATMLSPVEGRAIVPYLWRPWARFPLRVTVIDNDPDFTVARYAAIGRACERWRVATRGFAGGGVSFVVGRGRGTLGAQIVVRLRKNAELDGYGGVTQFPPGGWSLVQLSATRSSGAETDDVLLERVATHELGHALGIDGHSPDAGDVMSGEYGSTEITPADVNTLRIAYGL